MIQDSNPKDHPRQAFSEDVWERIDQINMEIDRLRQSNTEPKPSSPWRNAFWESMTILGTVIFSVILAFVFGGIVLKAIHWYGSTGGFFKGF